MEVGDKNTWFTECLQKHYVSLPKIYEFKNDKEKEILLNRNFKRVNQEVEDMVKELLGIS